MSHRFGNENVVVQAYNAGSTRRPDLSNTFYARCYLKLITGHRRPVVVDFVASNDPGSFVR